MRARFVSLHLDAIGFFASLVCALHCALLPILLLLLPFTQHAFLKNTHAEGALLVVSFVVAAISLRLSYLKHRRRRVLVMMSAGFCLLFLGIALAPTALAELLMTSSGGSLVALAHYLNWRYARRILAV